MALLSPGVELREVDESEVALSQATAVFGAVGGAKKGPVNEPVIVTGELDFLQKFGTPGTDTPMLLAVAQFLRRGRRAVVVRVADGTEAVAKVDVPGLATNARLFGLQNLSGGVNLEAYPKINIDVDGTGAVEIDLASGAADPTSVKLQEIIDAINAVLAQSVSGESIGSGDGLTTDFAGTVANPNILPGSFSITAGLVVAQDNGEGVLQGLGIASGTIDYVTGAYTVSFSVAPLGAVPVTADYVFDAVAFADKNSERLVLESPTAGAASSVEVLETATPAQNAAPFVLNGDIEYPLLAEGVAAAAIGATIEAASPGTWANGYAVRIEDDPERGQFKVTLIAPDGTELVPVNELQSATWDEELPSSESNLEVSGATGSRPQNGLYYLRGGKNGLSGLNDSHYIGTINPVTGAKSGLKLLDDPFSIDVNTIAVPGISSGAVVLEGMSACLRRGDAHFLVDPPLGLSVQDVADYHNGKGAYVGLHPAFNDSRGSIYWPWPEAFYPALNARVFTPPSGWVAAQYAYNDFVAEPWFAPAGLNRGLLPNALRLERTTDQAQRDFLYSGGNAVNVIADMDDQGIAIMGQKTLYRRDSALNRVNVRRLLNAAGKIIARASLFVAFEPTDKVTWRRLTSLINPVLKSIASRRGLERFEVVINESTNPPEVRNANRIGGKLYLIPIKSGEFVELDVVLLPSGAEIPEL